MIDDVQLLVQAVVENAKALGIKWTLRPGYISSLDFTQATASVVLDGDDTSITAINILGPINLNARVMCLIVPHEAVYVIGRLGNYGLGYQLSQTVQFTGSGTFTKSDYTGLRAVRVRCQAGGNGGGGAAATGASQTSGGSGGQGGGYAESFILTALLAASETVTVGGGGAGNSGASGSEGADSSFGTLVVADHGDASSVGLVAGAAGTGGFVTGGKTTQTSTGDLTISGGGGGAGGRIGVSGAVGGTGGSSQLGNGGSGSGVTTGAAAGTDGTLYGAGGGGACVGPSQTARAGGAGAAGIVLVDIYV
jgi:hypothetical protein